MRPKVAKGLQKRIIVVPYIIPTTNSVMSQIKKLIDKLNKKPVPSDMTFEELAKIARYYGCETESRGNHQRAIVHEKTGTVIPIPFHGKHVGVAYVRQFKELIESITREVD